MASIQSKLFDFVIRRQNLFGGNNFDPVAMRRQSEKAASVIRPHSKVKVTSVLAGTVPSEWLVPPAASADRAILYLHGGAWFLGSPRLYRNFLSLLALATGMRILAIDYRLAPEHPYPAALEDCLTAYDWLVKNEFVPHNLIVAGDSAGGNLTLSLLVNLRDRGGPLPAGAVALSPATDLAATGDSYRTRKHLDPYFHRASTATIVKDYVGTTDPCDPLLSPLYADLHGLPPLLIQVGDHEILLDDSLAFGKKAAAAGVQVKVDVWPGMFHVFQIYGSVLPEAKQAIRQVAEFIQERVTAN